MCSHSSPPYRAIALLLLALTFCCGGATQSAEPGIIRGEIAFPEVSGGALLPGGRLLLVSDNGTSVAVLPDALSRLRAGDVALRPGELLEQSLAGKVELDDLEDVAWDGTQSLFAVTSHSRTRGGDSPESRYRLARLQFDAAGKLLEARQTDALLNAIVNELPFLADAIRRTPARTGLNIEGLAWDPRGHLLVGFRAPTVTESKPRKDGGQEDAVVARVKNPEELFAEPARAAVLEDVTKLDLHGGGIRGMAYDTRLKGTWLLSGLSADPNHVVQSPWSLWLWQGEQSPREVRLPPNLGLEQPETVAPVELDGKPYLLLIDDGITTSPYALVPVPNVP